MSLSEWFLQSLELYREGQPSLPRPPFKLKDWLTVTGDGWYEAIEREVRQAIAFQAGLTPSQPPRFKNGALIADLRALMKVVNEQS